MRNDVILSFLILSLFVGCLQPEQEDKSFSGHGTITLVIHGGAGTITRQNMTEEKDKQYRDKLDEVLGKGYEVLQNGGTSIDAVTTVIQMMEESPLFNAGVGAVFTNDGKNELDASIMDGNTGKAGAVAGVSKIKSPILGALTVMHNSPHVMMSGRGAEIFAEQQGLEMVDSSYFATERRFNQLKNVLEKEQQQAELITELPDNKYSTVGAVALDQYGNIAAGTSTGGMTNKRYGRIGDSPIIGAGTYADNGTCGVSSTGHGEYFIRNVVAYDIAATMKYKELPLEDAANEVIMIKLKEKGGSGGVIALDRKGNIAMPFNTEGMFRGYIKVEGQPVVKIYKEEE